MFAGIRSDKDADKLKQSINQSNRQRVIPILIDVIKPETISAAVQQVQIIVANRQLVLRAVVNNSALASFGALELVDIDHVKQIYDVNVFGALRVSQAFLPLLRATVASTETNRRARLVLMSSLTGRFPSPWMGIYSATKADLQTLGDAYRMELHGSGIDVCIVEPGKMNTESQNLLDDMIPTNEDLHKTVPKVSSDVIDHYSKLYERVRRNVKKVNTWPIEQAAVTIEHIVRARYVQPRYQCSPDSAFGALVLSQLPEPIADLIMRIFMA